jgi:hypothetical protein
MKLSTKMPFFIFALVLVIFRFTAPAWSYENEIENEITEGKISATQNRIYEEEADDENFERELGEGKISAVQANMQREEALEVLVNKKQFKASKLINSLAQLIAGSSLRENKKPERILALESFVIRFDIIKNEREIQYKKGILSTELILKASSKHLDGLILDIRKFMK